MHWVDVLASGQPPVLELTAKAADDGSIVGVTRALGNELHATGLLGASLVGDAGMVPRGVPSWMTREAKRPARCGPPEAGGALRCVLLRRSDGRRWNEMRSIEGACHPQTVLADELNGQPLPIANGAPVRVRIERQLGYKMAKYIMAIELVDSLERIGGGKVGYWEDQDYEWYAGI